MKTLVRNPCRVEVQSRRLKELREEMRADLIVRPGQTFIEPEVPVVQFSSDGFNARWVADAGCRNGVRPDISRARREGNGPVTPCTGAARLAPGSSGQGL